MKEKIGRKSPPKINRENGIYASCYIKANVSTVALLTKLKCVLIEETFLVVTSIQSEKSHIDPNFSIW